MLTNSHDGFKLMCYSGRLSKKLSEQIKKRYVRMLKMELFPKIVHSAASSPCYSITTQAIAETIQMIALLGVDIRRVAKAVTLCHPLELRGKLIRG